MNACTAAALITPAALSTLWPRIRKHALQQRLALLHLVADEFAMLTEQFAIDDGELVFITGNVRSKLEPINRNTPFLYCCKVIKMK